jgi:hypothetical protein
VLLTLQYIVPAIELRYGVLRAQQNIALIPLQCIVFIPLQDFFLAIELQYSVLIPLRYIS